MVLKLYGFPISTCTRTVAFVLKELNVPFEFVVVDFTAGELKTSEHLKKQPFGKVPVINDDGFVLHESRAIARYLVQKYGQGSTLVPTGDFQKIALFEQAASIEQNNFNPHISGLAYEKLFKPFFGLTTDENQVTFFSTTLEAKLAVYDKILANQKYCTLRATNSRSLTYSTFHMASYWKNVGTTGSLGLSIRTSRGGGRIFPPGKRGSP